METITIDEQMKNLYEQINEHYETINRELVNKIVHRFNEIIDLYYDFALSHINDEEIEKEKNIHLPKQILRNEELPEASTFDTVLTLIDMVFCFMSIYDNRCFELFKFSFFNKYDWSRFDVRKFDMGWKHHYRFNDYNIPSTVERFLNISDREIWHLLMLNFPNGNYGKINKWRSFDGITNLPYPSFENEK